MPGSITPLSNKQKLAAITVSIAVLFFIVWEKLPVQDSPDYFKFADARNILSINNFSDVVSNLIFAVSGILGLNWLNRRQPLPLALRRLGYIMAISIAFVSVGSAYFHYDPNPKSLFWDRLPMVFAFASVVGLVLCDRVDETVGVITFLLLSCASTFILVLWNFEILSLRPYIFVQFGSILFILMSILFLQENLISNSVLWKTLGFYGVAKIAESHDADIFRMTGFISGHTVKHLLAGIAMIQLLTIFRSSKNRDGHGRID